MENEDFLLTLESMAADPAYLIFEYNLKIKDTAMEKIKKVPYDEFDGYKIGLSDELFINNQKPYFNARWGTVEKISDNEFRIVHATNIANIKESVLDIKEKIKSIYVLDESNQYKLNSDISQEIAAKVTFSDKQKKILAQSTLSNGSTLYIEEVANSKFENYVLARIITNPQTVKDMNDKNKEFMIEDPQFAICDENNNTINYKSNRLEEYYEKVLSDGNVETCNLGDLKDTDLVRMQQVQLLRLGFEEEKIRDNL